VRCYPVAKCTAPTKHGVLIRVRRSNDDLGTATDDELVERLDDAIRTTLDRKPIVGRWDGHEFGAGWATIFCYGRDAKALTIRIRDALLALDISSRTVVVRDSDTPGTLDNLMFMTTIGTRGHTH